MGQSPRIQNQQQQQQQQQQQPTMGTTRLPGAKPGSTMNQKYYTDPSQLPPGGGYVKASSGAGVNWMMPTAPAAPRQQLADAMTSYPRFQRNGRWLPVWDINQR